MIPRLDRRLFLGAGAGLLLTGCSTASAGDTPAAPATSSAPTTASAWVTPRELPAGWGSGQDDGVFPRTVVHAAGSTTVPARPTRVVVVSTGQMDAALTLGVVPVGATAGDGAGRVPDYLRARFPDRSADLDAVADLGTRTQPNLEAVAALAPDLVLVNASAKDGDVLGALQAIAPTVVTQGTGLRWKQDLLLLADGLGLRQRAQTWLDEHHARAAALAPSPSPTVSFLRRNGDRVRVFGVASFSGSVAEDAGLARPQGQRFTDETSRDVSAEQLDLADADRLFFGVQGGDAAELTSLPTWGDLGAVRTGRAVQVDDDAFFLNTGPTAARIVLEELERALG